MGGIGWMRRYAPLEVAGTGVALVAALAVWSLGGRLAAAGAAAALGEIVGFYTAAAVLEARRRRATPTRGSRGTLGVVRALCVEFGPAEVVDSALVRPAAMALAPVLLGHLVLGVLAGKAAADVVFYVVAATSRRAAGRVTDRAAGSADAGPARTPAGPGDAEGTPALLLDLEALGAAHRGLVDALPGIGLHYAVKCNPDPAVLAHLHGLGCGFEIASATELRLLLDIGVRPAEVLFSNPVKPPAHIAEAAAAGVRRFAADCIGEIAKLAELAPGCEVYVRLAVPSGRSLVASEGKFGVDPATALELLAACPARGLVPLGVAFHVGSQTVDPRPWESAVEIAAGVLRQARIRGLRLRWLDIGGGFPVTYSDGVQADLDLIGSRLIKACRRWLPSDIEIVAEPGRALVATAGTLVTTVIGVAERAGRRWVHLDVGAFNGFMEALETANALRYPVRPDGPVGGPPALHNLTGPTCDSQDTILFDVPLPTDLAVGDRLLFGCAGAYTTSYASTFNGFDVPQVRLTPPGGVALGLPVGWGGSVEPAA